MHYLIIIKYSIFNILNSSRYYLTMANYLSSPNISERSAWVQTKQSKPPRAWEACPAPWSRAPVLRVLLRWAPGALTPLPPVFMFVGCCEVRGGHSPLTLGPAHLWTGDSAGVMCVLCAHVMQSLSQHLNRPRGPPEGAIAQHKSNRKIQIVGGRRRCLSREICEVLYWPGRT